MPNEVQPKPGAKNGKSVKGKPLGIPMWGWIAGAAIGLIIGYILVKRSGSSSASSDTGTGPSPLGGSNSGTGGGVVASPPPDSIIAAAGGNDQPLAGDTEPPLDYNPGGPFQPAASFGGLASPTGVFSGQNIDPTFSMEQPQGAGGSAFQFASASGAGTYIPSIINNPAPPTSNVSEFNPNLPRHALNIGAT